MVFGLRGWRGVVEDDDVCRGAVVGGAGVEGGLGDLMEEGAGDFDAPAALAGGFEVFPAFPADVAGGVDVDAEVDGGGVRVVKSVEAFDDDEVLCSCGRGDALGSHTAVGLEGPDGDVGGQAAAEGGEVGEEALKVGFFGEIAPVFGDAVVVGEVVVGGDDAGAEHRGERALACADGAGDADDAV